MVAAGVIIINRQDGPYALKLPRVVVAGVSSGVGKTSITCAIIRVMRRQGLAVSPFKVGPDYIDPVYLGVAAGRDARNLDVWVMGGARRALEGFASNSQGSDVSVIEGVMGYYDGHSGYSDYASTYHMASITRSPVILVADTSKAARSVAATVLGFRAFQKNSRIAGVILNKLGSVRHALMCQDALRSAGIPVLGSIYRDASMALEERHLGLHSTVDREELEKKIERITDVVEPRLDVKKLLTIAYSAGLVPAAAAAAKPRKTPNAVLRNRELIASYKKEVKNKDGPVIAVALDSSFNFYYQGNLDALRREGAQLKFFSPASDKKPPACDALYIGGGFPEVLAAPLEQNQSMKKSIKKMAEDGMPVYAECGGLMYLSKSITSKQRKKYGMVGLFDAGVVMTSHPVINYTKGVIGSGTPITGSSDRKFRGHEFHYSRMSDLPRGSGLAICLYDETCGGENYGIGIQNGNDGLMIHNTLASYGHIYFDVADFASHFVANCARYRRR